MSAMNGKEIKDLFQMFGVNVSEDMCINCGKPGAKMGEGYQLPLCDRCENACNRMRDMLKAGIRVEFDDGSVETLKAPEDEV